MDNNGASDPLEAYVSKYSGVQNSAAQTAPNGPDPLEAYVNKHSESQGALPGGASEFAAKYGSGTPDTFDQQKSTLWNNALNTLGGYGSNIKAGISKAWDAVAPQGLQSGQNYTQLRDTEEANQTAQNTAHPYAAVAGKGVGILGQLAAGAALGGPAALAAPEAGLMARLGSAAKTGAIGMGTYGALSNPGNVQGEVTPVQPVERLKNGLIGTGMGAVAGPLLEGGASVAKDIFGASKQVYGDLLHPEISPDYAGHVDTAKELGIDPNNLTASTQFGKLSPNARMERSLAEGPTGKDIIDNFIDSKNKIDTGLTGTVKNIAGGEPLNPVAAGETVKQAYQDQLQKLFDANTVTYKSAAKLSPDLQITPDAQEALQSAIDGLRKRATGYITRGATDEQVTMGKDLLGLASRLENNGSNYGQLSDQIGFIGDAMTNPNLNRTHSQELKKIYGTLSDALVGTVKDLNPDLGQQLIDNNKRMSGFFQSRDLLGRQIQDAGSNPEALFKNLTGNAVKVDELKKVMEPEQFDQLRGSFMNSLIKRNADGDILYGSSLNALTKNQGRLEKMFSPDELDKVQRYLQLGDAQGIPVLSTSGTGGSNAFREAKKTIQNGLINKNILNQARKNAGLLNGAE